MRTIALITLMALGLGSSAQAAGTFDGGWQGAGVSERGCSAPFLSLTIENDHVVKSLYQGARQTDGGQGSIESDGHATIYFGRGGPNFVGTFLFTKEGTFEASVITPNCGTTRFKGVRKK